MKAEEKIISELKSKSKLELIEELLELRNGNGKDTTIKKIELDRSSELSDLIVENSHDGIMIIGDEYKIEYINSRLIELTGFSQQDLIGKDFRIFLEPEAKQLAVGRYHGRRDGLQLDSSFELNVIAKKGESKIFEVRSTIFYDSDKKQKTLSQFKDITQRKLTEEAVRQSEEKFRSIVENSHLGIMIVNMNFQFEYVNEQLCKILKTSKQKLEGKDFRKFLAKDSVDLVSERYKKRQQGIEVPSDYNIKLLTTDGEEREVKLSVSVVNFNGNIKSIAQVLDITESIKKEKLEGALLNISQAVNEENNLNEFLGIVREQLATILDTTNFYVALYDKYSDTYTFPYHVDEFDVVDDITQLELKDSLTDYVRRKNKSILVNSKTQTVLENEGEIKGIVGQECPVWLGSPLTVDNTVVGVIGMQNYHNEDAYNENDLELLKIISENVSSAIWKKQIIDKLTESETRYRDFISRSSEGIYRLDFDPPISTKLPKKEQVYKMFTDGSVGECNNSFAKMYAHSSYKELIGKNLNVFYGNTISEYNFNSFLNFIDNGYKVTDVETYEVDAKGEELVILNNSIGIIKDEQLVNIWGIQKDITESNRLQNALKQIAQGISSSIGDSFFRSLVTFIGETLKVDFAFIAKLSDDMKYANSLALWGENKIIDNFNYPLKNCPSNDVLNQNKTIYLTDVRKKYPKDKFLQKNKITSYMGRPLLNSNDSPIGLIIILQRGEIANLEFTQSVLEIFASRSSAEIERLQYVKEIVAAKELAEKSNNLKSDFLAQMSHEIRTPVNTILSFTSLLKENLEDKLDEDLKDSFKIIDNGGRRLIRTIDLILNVSQIQSGSLTLSTTRINLVGVLRDLTSEFSKTAEKKSLELKFISNFKKLNIIADNYTLTQIFANLIHNAIKYTTTGSIKIYADKDENSNVIVKVIDTGVGMSDDFLTKLFDPFSQEETGYTRRFEGTGLGLTLVRKYCELNNAEISVDTKKDLGSTFIVKFNKQSPDKNRLKQYSK